MWSETSRGPQWLSGPVPATRSSPAPRPRSHSCWEPGRIRSCAGLPFSSLPLSEALVQESVWVSARRPPCWLCGGRGLGPQRGSAGARLRLQNCAGETPFCFQRQLKPRAAVTAWRPSCCSVISINCANDSQSSSRWTSLSVLSTASRAGSLITAELPKIWPMLTVNCLHLQQVSKTVCVLAHDCAI